MVDDIKVEDAPESEADATVKEAPAEEEKAPEVAPKEPEADAPDTLKVGA